jgi:hypothetical protein
MLLRKKMLIRATLVLIVILFTLTIRVKHALDIEIATNYAEVNVDSLIGHMVTLLCEYDNKEMTDPPKYEFGILAIANENGFFEPLKVNRDGQMVSIHGLYVYPKFFIGGAVKKYNFGFRNRFVFRGVLRKAPVTKNGSSFGDYKIYLKSWDIVYPVHHWEFYLGPNNDFNKRHIFVFDYLI